MFHNISQITLCVTCCRWSHPQQSYGSPGAGAGVGWAGYSGQYALPQQQVHYSPQHHCYPATYQYQHHHPPASSADTASSATSSSASSSVSPPQQDEHHQQGQQWGPQLSPGQGDKRKVRLLSGFRNLCFSKQGVGECVQCWGEYYIIR